MLSAMHINVQHRNVRNSQLESSLWQKGHELGNRKGSTLDHELQPPCTCSLSRFRGRDMDRRI
ncbi:conjugal transfer protein TraA [Komagataeibacter xylinus]|uniref:Conjugal transfer protein TraA n=2 Tax=Komagataeibacter xylinus TaxID=28448 RepID=A0A857FRX6_KOMXY|nr:conjugal transfer protein TraA [Komagataeibacter xylinus]